MGSGAPIFIETPSERSSKTPKAPLFPGPDHTHMFIPESVHSTYQLWIEGQTLDIPSDPVESFRFIHEQTPASYRAVVCGNSTAPDQTLTFGVVVPGPGTGPGEGAGSRGSSLPKPAHLDAGVITGNNVKKAHYQVPAEIIKIPDSPTPLRRSRRKRTKLSQPETHIQPPSHATIMDSQHTGVAYKCENGFIGDFLNPYDVRSKTGRSICWAEGKYLNGQISLGDVFAKTAVQTKRCSQCVRIRLVGSFSTAERMILLSA